MELIHRPIDFVADREYVLERHCRINYACDSPWATEISYDEYREQYFAMVDYMNKFWDEFEDGAKDTRTIAEIVENEAGDKVAYLWVAFHEEQASGFSYADVQDIYVEEEYRQMGIASQLMEYAEEKAKENGVKVIRSGTGIGNTKSFGLHNKLGYHQYRYEFEKLL